MNPSMPKQPLPPSGKEDRRGHSTLDRQLAAGPWPRPNPGAIYRRRHRLLNRRLSLTSARLRVFLRLDRQQWPPPRRSRKNLHPLPQWLPVALPGGARVAAAPPFPARLGLPWRRPRQG